MTKAAKPASAPPDPKTNPKATVLPPKPSSKPSKLSKPPAPKSAKPPAPMPAPIPAPPAIPKAPIAALLRQPPRAYNFRRPSHVELAKALIQQLEVTVDGKLRKPIFDEGNLYAYDVKKGIWAKKDEVEAGRIIQSFDGAQAGQKATLKLKESDIKGGLACARREVNVDGFFANAPAGLVFKDVLVTVGAGGAIEKKAHATENRARHSYDFDYCEREPKKFLKAMRGMFLPDEDAEEKIRLVGEFAGAALLGGATKLQRWVLLKGNGDDGKSTLIDMIRNAMPAGATCSIKPEDLEDQYSRADLAGKLLNTVTEVKQREVLDAETLKACTAGDEMRGRKIREAPIDFKPRAAHLFAANGYPKFSDSSHGFWRRPIVITFNRRFTGDPERKVGLADEIVRDEKAEIVCWLVRQGAKALARGNYIEPKSHFAALNEWRGETDAVFEFVADRLVVAKSKVPGLVTGWSFPSDLYKAFRAWAEATGHRDMSSTAFGRRLTELGYADKMSGGGQRFRPLRLIEKGQVKNEDGTLAAN
jgi:P4 family phage/plasmid primase-like protien